jgi:hypothetical protein
MGDLPTVDHVGIGLDKADFKICAWRVNDAKNDLGLDEFLELCSQVLEHHKHRCLPSSEDELTEKMRAGSRASPSNELPGSPSTTVADDAPPVDGIAHFR